MSPTHAEDFIKQGLHLRGWSTRTVRTYRQGLATLPATLTKASLAAWVVEMRPRGVSAAGVNMYARTINSYLTWLHEEGHTPERLRIKLLPNPPKPLKTFSDADIRKLLTFKPEANFNSAHGRSSSPLFDTGIRIDEALGLERERVDLDGLIVTVVGNASPPVSFRSIALTAWGHNKRRSFVSHRCSVRGKHRNSSQQGGVPDPGAVAGDRHPGRLHIGRGCGRRTARHGRRLRHAAPGSVR